jgi:glycosyltransferase involved in cell wall biosynthesis
VITWIASFPRSGNTYLRVLLKRCLDMDSYSIYEEGTLAEVIGYRANSMSPREMAAADEPFLVKQHDLPTDDFPAIYLVRDGRDALVSYAHYVLTDKPKPEAEARPELFNQTLHDLIVYNASFGGWGPHVLAWASRSAPTAIVRFEELVSSGDPLSIVSKALNDIGYLNHPSTFLDRPPSFSELHKQGPRFFREGKIGSWKREMPADLLELFWDTHGEAMERMQYSIEEQLAFQRDRGRRRLQSLHDMQEELLAKEKFIQVEYGRTAEKDQLLQSQHGELEARERTILSEHRELEARERIIQSQHGELEVREKIIHSQQSALESKDRRLERKQRELESKESVIQSFRASYFYWFVNGPLRWIRWSRPIADRLRAIRGAFRGDRGAWRYRVPRPRFMPAFPLKIPLPKPVANQFRRLRAIFLPRIGILEQHAPRPLQLPDWYKQTPPGAARQPRPSISIVTPSYNQAEFIERTIRSVLEQEYPNLEYVVQDGNSQDGTLDVLRSFAPRLAHFESRPDGGQAHALNLGFQNTRGEIMSYLNSDDLLMPGTLQYVAAYFAGHPKVDVVYSHRVIIDADDREIGRWVLPRHDHEIILWADYVPQETLFWRRTLWELTGGYIDETYQFALDWDLILRFRGAGAEFVRLPRFLAAFRMQPRQKTVAAMDHTGTAEMERLRRRVHGRDIDWREIKRHTRPYLARSVFYQKLYRLGILRY